MEIKKADDGSSIFNVFFKASPEAWYYFGFEGNRLWVQSSNSDFNSVIIKKTNTNKAKIGEVAFIPGSEDETRTFTALCKRAYVRAIGGNDEIFPDNSNALADGLRSVVSANNDDRQAAAQALASSLSILNSELGEYLANVAAPVQIQMGAFAGAGIRNTR